MSEIRGAGTGDREQRQQAPASVVARKQRFLPSALCPLPPTRGISLLEVLISMFILAVGLLSIASLLPVGGFQVEKAKIEDRKSTVGQNAFHEFRTRGMANAENWDVPQLPPGQTFPRPASIAIDPLALTAASPVGSASAEFPRANSSPANAPRMPRIGLRSIGVIAQSDPAAAHQLAQQIFMSHDDTVFEDDPTNPDAPPVSRWEVNNSGNPIRRQFEGNFSWLATLAPAYFDVTPRGPWAWPTEYRLSIVIFYKRNLNLLTNDEGVAFERQVPVDTSDLAGFGFGGGELVLNGTEADTAVRHGSWIMVCGRYGDPTNGIPVFRWYRVVTVGAYESSNTPPARPVTLAGPDWVTNPSTNYCNPTHVAIFDGAVGVFEKTVHLEGPSVWGY